jgi:hypothetical protein
VAERLRLAELVGALSLATDLGMGQPLEQALRTCLIALAIGDRLDLNAGELSDVFYVALLRFLGCTADAHDFAALVGGDDIAIRAAIAPVLGRAIRRLRTRCSRSPRTTFRIPMQSLPKPRDRRPTRSGRCPSPDLNSS